jgi:hypothetical protein
VPHPPTHRSIHTPTHPRTHTWCGAARRGLSRGSPAGGQSLTTREVFDKLDDDKSGFLDRGEIDRASGLLAGSLGVLMTTEEQEKAFRRMDPDGDGQVGFGRMVASEIEAPILSVNLV